MHHETHHLTGLENKVHSCEWSERACLPGTRNGFHSTSVQGKPNDFLHMIRSQLRQSVTCQVDTADHVGHLAVSLLLRAYVVSRPDLIPDTWWQMHNFHTSLKYNFQYSTISKSSSVRLLHKAAYVGSSKTAKPFSSHKSFDTSKK